LKSSRLVWVDVSSRACGRPSPLTFIRASRRQPRPHLLHRPLSWPRSCLATSLLVTGQASCRCSIWRTPVLGRCPLLCPPWIRRPSSRPRRMRTTHPTRLPRPPPPTNNLNSTATALIRPNNSTRLLTSRGQAGEGPRRDLRASSPRSASQAGRPCRQA
jgi:hypothetical protein